VATFTGESCQIKKKPNTPNPSTTTPLKTVGQNHFGLAGATLICGGNGGGGGDTNCPEKLEF
jgi:hypothetical protein